MKQKRPARKKLAAKKPTPSVNVDERVFRYPVVAPIDRGNEININNQPDQVNAGKNLAVSSSSSSSSSDNEGSFNLEIVSSGSDEPASKRGGSQKKGQVSRRTTNAPVMPLSRLVSNVMSSRGSGSGSGSKFMPPKVNGLSSISRKELLPSLSQDPRYNKLELKTSLAVIKKAMKMDEAGPFNSPVDPVSQGLPDYFTVINTPMDFGTICSNLQNGVKYMNSDDVYKDVNYIWENCRNYNKKGDYIVYLMKRVTKKFINYWKSAGLRTEILGEHGGTGNSHSLPSSDHAMWQNTYDALSVVNRMVTNSNRMQQDKLGIGQPQPQTQPQPQPQPQPYQPQPQPSTIQVPPFFQLHAGEGSSHTAKTISRKSKFLKGLRIVSHDGANESQAENIYASSMHAQSQPHQAPKDHDSLSLGRNFYFNQAPQQAKDDTFAEHIAKKWPQKSKLSSGVRNVSHVGPSMPQAENGCASFMHVQSQSHQAAALLGRDSHLNEAPQQTNDDSYTENIAKKKPRKSKLSSSARTVTHDGPIESQADDGNASLVCNQSQSHQAAVGHDSISLERNSDLNQEPRGPQQGNDDIDTEHIAKKKPRKSKSSSSARTVTHDGPIESQAEDGNASLVRTQSQSHKAAVGHDSISLGRNSDLNQAPQGPQQENDDVDTEHIDTFQRRYKKRGKTTMEAVWKLKSNEKIFVEVDKHGVPCTKEGATLASFLGTIATNGVLAPLNILRWRDKEYQPFQQKMLSIVEERFVFPPVTRKWVLKSINKKWRGHKGDLKARYFDMTKTREEVEATVPEDVVPSQWPVLVKSWYTEENQRMTEINTANARKKKNTHTCGRKSFGRRRKEMEEEMGHSPDRLTFYDAIHKRKDGTYVDENVKKLMEKAFALRSKRSKTSNANITEINEQIFQEVVGDECDGRRSRGLRMGPTPKSYFASGASSSQTNDDVASLKEQLQEMTNKYEEVCGKYDDVSVQYKDVKQNYEGLSAKYDEVSETLLAMANFMSQKFPELQTPPVNDDQVDGNSSSRRSASSNNVSSDASDSS